MEQTHLTQSDPMPAKNNSAKAKARKAEVIYLGIDVHADKHVVVRQIEGATPQPAQSFKPEALVAWVNKQRQEAVRIVACYEAGPFGYSLCRQLQALGITCHVVRPRLWDQHGQNVKTDARDARALCEALERFERGNHHALALVRVPSEAEEQQRSRGRQRTALVKERRTLEANGRSTALYYGHRLKGRWWTPRAWKGWEQELDAFLVRLLQPLRVVLLAIEEQIKTLTEDLQQSGRERAAQTSGLPAGLGDLTSEILAQEVCDWSRFNNRRQVASYTGLCPGEHSSGGSRKQGAINKHGNPRLRAALVEAVWRLLRHQPQWVRWRKAQAKWLQAAKARRKQLLIALARQLAIDLWRLATGRTTLANLGLKANPLAVPVATAIAAR